MFEHKDTTL